METYSSSLENVCKLTTCIEHKWKHGGSEWVFTDEAFRAPFDCSIIGIEDTFIVIKSADKNMEYKYPLPANYELTSLVDLKKGDIIFTLKEKIHITKKLADISGFLGTVSVIDELKNVSFTDCYSLDEGTIHYEAGNVVIGGCILPRYRDQIYYYSEGEKVDRFTRICSGIQNMKSVASKLKDRRLEFIIFRKQLLRLLPSLNPDICEVVFKCINNFDYAVKSKLDKGTNLISSLYMGSTVGGKKVLQNFVNQGVKLFDENDLLYKLIFAQGLTEGVNV